MALNLLSMFGVASGLLDIFGGTRKKKDNSKIANAQEKLARQRYDYNIKESNDAYEENLRNTFAGYATQRMGVISTAKDEISKINAPIIRIIIFPLKLLFLFCSNKYLLLINYELP